MSTLAIRDIEGSLDPRMVEAELRSRNIVTPQQLSIALSKRASLAEAGDRIGLCEILLRDRFLSRTEADAFIESLANERIDAADKIIADELCTRYKVRPLQVIGGVLHMEAAGPLLRSQLEILRTSAIMSISDIKIIPVSKIDYSSARNQNAYQYVSLSEAVSRLKRTEISSEGLRTTIASLLSEAIAARASDIHLECNPDPGSWIAFRVDGNMRQIMLVPERVMSAIFTRLKTLAGMDASDRLRAQDGRISHKHGSRVIDLRMASQPLMGGEKITLRILDQDAIPSRSDLFVGQPIMADLFAGLSDFKGKRGGLILISGPTGSGKTATLYTLLQNFERDKFNVITVEDPVEYTISFVRQIQINQILNQKAVDIERAILRHDPDIIMFGEVRNRDMASAVLSLAESGHQVLATIHAGNALETFDRFLNFFPDEVKVEKSKTLATYLGTVINQRLVRRLCKCAETVEDGRNERKAVGCEICGGEGYIGRVAVHDSLFLPGDDARRDSVTRAVIKEGDLKAALGMPGVFRFPRETVINSLVDAGVIDNKTRSNALEA